MVAGDAGRLKAGPFRAVVAARLAPLAGLVATVLLGLALLLAPPAIAGPDPPLGTEGRWVVDRQGRAVVLHGLQVAHKKPPYHPPPESFDEEDAKLIRRLGFNSVRLAVFWSGLEPARDRLDRRYLDEIRREVEVLTREGIFVLLDMAQYGYSARVGGTGFPNWATYTDGVPPGPGSGALLYFTPAVWRAFDNLWLDREGVQDEFADFWRVLARTFRDEPRMVGYDLFNEPFPGTQSATCAQPAGCPAFDRAFLQPLQDKLARAVRQEDPRAIAWYEPNVLFDFGVASHLGPAPDDAQPVGFAFHAYCLGGVPGTPDHESEAPTYPSCEVTDDGLFGNAEQTAQVLGGPPLFDEFGDTQDVEHIETSIQRADAHRMGWMYWGYKDWVDEPGGEGDGPIFDDENDNSTLRRDKVAVVSRPYPQVVAGTPERYSFDRERGLFELTYRNRLPGGAPPGPAQETEIFVPEHHYPAGYRVRTEGARVTSAPAAATLRLRARRGAERVAISVSRR